MGSNGNTAAAAQTMNGMFRAVYRPNPAHLMMYATLLRACPMLILIAELPVGRQMRRGYCCGWCKGRYGVSTARRLMHRSQATSTRPGNKPLPLCQASITARNCIFPTPTPPNFSNESPNTLLSGCQQASHTHNYDIRIERTGALHN